MTATITEPRPFTADDTVNIDEAALAARWAYWMVQKVETANDVAYWSSPVAPRTAMATVAEPVVAPASRGYRAPAQRTGLAGIVAAIGGLLVHGLSAAVA